MKKIFAILFVSLLIVSCEQGLNDETVTYTVAIDDDNIEVAKVRMEFTPEDSILIMDYGASHLENRWAAFIHNIKAVNEEGETVELEEIPDAKWIIHGNKNEKIVLTYDVRLDHEDYEWSGGIDGVAYSTGKGVFYTGRTLFIMNGEQRKNIIVGFQLPPDWSVTTPWIKNTDAFSYGVMNNTDLVNAMIFAGTHKDFSLKRDDFELVFALGSADIIADEAVYRDLAKGVLDYYTELMGGVPRPSPDEPIKKIVVVVSSHPSVTDGEVVGNNISILIKEDAGQFEKTISRFIFAHEFFHLWNGKSFTPESEDSEWFKEGLTNYYTLKALHHVSLLTDESYLDFLGTFFYKRYHDDNGTGKLSMAYGEEKHNHWGLIYGGGMLVGIAQDLMIRDATDNAKSMDDLMQDLLIGYGNSNETYTLEELQYRMSDLSGLDQSEFFNSYVTGTGKIPIENYLPLAGLTATIENGNLIITKKELQTQKQQKIMRGMFGETKTSEPLIKLIK